MMLIAILVFYLGAGFTAAVLDYYQFEDMIQYYDNLYIIRSAGVNGSTSDS